MKPRNRWITEFKWLMGIVLATALVLLMVPRPWLGAAWVFPMPNTRGPVWVNFNSPMLWCLLVFFMILGIVTLFRIVLHLIRKAKKQNV